MIEAAVDDLAAALHTSWKSREDVSAVQKVAERAGGRGCGSVRRFG